MLRKILLYLVGYFIAGTVFVVVLSHMLFRHAVDGGLVGHSVAVGFGMTIGQLIGVSMWQLFRKVRGHENQGGRL